MLWVRRVSVASSNTGGPTVWWFVFLPARERLVEALPFDRLFDFWEPRGFWDWDLFGPVPLFALSRFVTLLPRGLTKCPVLGIGSTMVDVVDTPVLFGVDWGNSD